MVIDAHPWVVFGRLLTCQKCGAHVDSIEIDLTTSRADHWLAGDVYCCGQCMTPVETVASARWPALRRDMSNYNPANEPIPY